MTGRGRGRGALARWEAAKTSGQSTSRVGSSVFAISKVENWEEDEVKKPLGDSTRSDTLARVTNIIDVEHFWAQTGKFLSNLLHGLENNMLEKYSLYNPKINHRITWQPSMNICYPTNLFFCKLKVNSQVKLDCTMCLELT